MIWTIYSVALSGGSKIGVMARPRGGDWLGDEIRSIREQGFSVLVSLLTDAEQKELQLESEGLSCEQLALTFIRLPIEDMRVPSLDEQTIDTLAKLREFRSTGNSIAVHCRAGIGRSPMIAACIMLSRSCNVTSAFHQLSAARGMKVPETPEQREWAVAYEKLLLAPQKLS
jgi:protein-tyrosine phosphatase